MDFPSQASIAQASTGVLPLSCLLILVHEMDQFVNACDAGSPRFKSIILKVSSCDHLWNGFSGDNDPAV